jgi:site-specific recombinase XerD
MPSIVAEASPQARFSWDEFFSGKIPNPHTKRSYLRTVRHFLAWCEGKGIELVGIAPGHVGEYLSGLTVSVASKKVMLAALRRFFDVLVNRHAVLLNPAATAETEKHQDVEGKTPEIGKGEARTLLGSIRTDTVVGLRDRAIVAILIYTAARVGAVAKLRRKHFYTDGSQWFLRFSEKRGKSREIPVRHDLEGFVKEYLERAGLLDAAGDTPLFRSSVRRTGVLTPNGVTAGDVGRMVKRRLEDAGLSARFSCHSFRVATITDLLEQGIPVEDVQHLAGHSDPRTTRLYDRRSRKITRNIVERISI